MAGDTHFTSGAHLAARAAVVVIRPRVDALVTTIGVPIAAVTFTVFADFTVGTGMAARAAVVRVEPTIDAYPIAALFAAGAPA
ncbi:MAG: hypothetical protein WBW04_02150 [Nitrolancea sp.]